MSLGPILPGRLPTSLVTSRLTRDIQASSTALARLQDQIASGKKYFLPGENPTSSIRALILQKTLDSRNQIQANISTDRTFLANTESTLAPVSDLLNRAKSALQAGLGSSSTDVERAALADEVATMLQGALGIANANFQGRYLFAGTQNSQPPFQLIGGAVRYVGDSGAINSFIDVNTLVANNVDGATAFGALSAQIGSDINPALTSSTRISDLLAGRGVTLGKIELTLDDGVNPVQTAIVDLTSAETIGDIETRLENAFAGSPITLDVDIDSTSQMGIRLTPSGGTIAIADVTGSTVARDLGILGGPAASIVGS
ncbi:MAG: flagellar hook-associated protein FlgL, partial [Planctomycetaceae bacterium]